MNGYNLTQRQKELLQNLVALIRKGKLEEPILPISFASGEYHFNLKEGKDWVVIGDVRGDLIALCDADLMSSTRGVKTGTQVYHIKQAGYDAVDNNFASPVNTDNIDGKDESMPKPYNDANMKNPREFDTALENYKVEKILGEGGSGRVYLTKDSKGNEFAIKYLRPELVLSDRLNRFKNELEFSRINTHPNILSLRDYGFVEMESKKIPFYVMRLYPSNLRQLISSGLVPEMAYELFQKMLYGIEEAHRNDIWHRDIKPENILIDSSDSSLVIADFGIAHFSEDELYTAVQTQKSERLANFQYAAPEQRTKGSQVDQRADIYALGLILNEMFTGETPSGTEYMKVSEKSKAFSYLDAIVEHMIRQSPKKRPASINEIRLEMFSARQSMYMSGEPHLEQSGIRKALASRSNVRAEVDCVGRLDDLTCDTVLSISAGLSFSIVLPAKEKQNALLSIQKGEPGWGITRCRVYLYTLLLFMLIKDYIRKIDIIVIDPEYIGYESQIKDTLLQLLRRLDRNVNKEKIKFERIDRKSTARIIAARVYKGDEHPDFIIGTKQLFEASR